MKAQPKGSAPVSRDVVEVVKQKLAPPRGPPPAGMANFKAPKAVNRDTYNERDVSADSYDMDEADHRGHARHRDNDYDDYDNDRNRRGGRGHRDDDEDNNDNRRRRGDRNDRNRDDDYDDYDDTRRDRYDDDSISRSNYKDRRKDRTDDRSRGREDLEIAVHEDTNSTNKTWKKGGRDMEIKHLKPESPKPQVRNASALPEAKPVQDTASNQSQQTKLVLFNYQPVLRATYRELKEFVTKPAAPGVTTRCYIERNRSGSKMLAPFYSLCADLEDGTGRELMVCRKILKSRMAHYVFSLKSEDLWRKREQRSRLFLGKLRAVGPNDYVLYDNGICKAPKNDDIFDDMGDEEDDEVDDDDEDEGQATKKKNPVMEKMTRDAKAEGKSEEVSLYRRELLSIHFNTKHRPAPAGVRGSEICIPLVTSVQLHGKNGDAKGGASSTAPIYGISNPFAKIRDEGKQNELFAKTCYILHERTSRYDPLSSCLVDFKGRANMASVKNCQFVESSPEKGASDTFQKNDAEKDFILQLGKTTDDCFNLDYRHPLSLLQAFALSIARFDAKLTW